MSTPTCETLSNIDLPFASIYKLPPFLNSYLWPKIRLHAVEKFRAYSKIWNPISSQQIIDFKISDR
jgi:hypothetical protein